MIADQMKKRCSPECKEHFLDIWEDLISPETLADKLEAFDNIRRSLPSGPRRYVKASETVNVGRQVSFRKLEPPPKKEYSHQLPNERSPLRCYDCGKQGVIKSRCPTCNLNASQRTDVATNHINAYTAQTRSPRLTLIDITFCRIKGRVCADTGSSHSIAGERMFQIFKDKGLLLQETTLAMSLADGQQTTDVKNTCWYFWDNPTHKYPFGEELDIPSIVEKMSSNTCQLREEEGESLTSAQKEKLNLLLESFQNVFEPGGKDTNILEHHINTGNSPPISVPPYRMSPIKNCPDCIKYKASQIRSLPGYYRHLCQPDVLKRWPLISSGPYLRVKMVKDGSSSLRIIPPNGSNCLHYPMPQLKNVPLP
ncbi:uncharacterized protein TNCV_1090591 [Trichonephila clavipes]|uniref:CCHC-type domain-containing protein n=1 Tax=Trichonephila clavipes TaxID=2585209 RepID=A0A8X6VR37_TRICX|nr:uncharacterized protein TNCV_1090591 [Trichonephila clavipes]